MSLGCRSSGWWRCVRIVVDRQVTVGTGAPGSRLTCGVGEDQVGIHGSGLRSLLAEATGVAYVSFVSLDQAREESGVVVVLEGDEGGQIYAAFLASGVGCAEERLAMLLRDLDAIAWPGNDEGMARVVYERLPIGSGIAGGMGGGMVQPHGWVHPQFVSLEIEAEIRSVVAGRQDRISETSRHLGPPG